MVVPHQCPGKRLPSVLRGGPVVEIEEQLVLCLFTEERSSVTASSRNVVVALVVDRDLAPHDATVASRSRPLARGDNSSRTCHPARSRGPRSPGHGRNGGG